VSAPCSVGQAARSARQPPSRRPPPTKTGLVLIAYHGRVFSPAPSQGTQPAAAEWSRDGAASGVWAAVLVFLGACVGFGWRRSPVCPTPLQPSPIVVPSANCTGATLSSTCAPRAAAASCRRPHAMHPKPKPRPNPSLNPNPNLNPKPNPTRLLRGARAPYLHGAPAPGSLAAGARAAGDLRALPRLHAVSNRRRRAALPAGAFSQAVPAADLGVGSVGSGRSQLGIGRAGGLVQNRPVLRDVRIAATRQTPGARLSARATPL